MLISVQLHRAHLILVHAISVTVSTGGEINKEYSINEDCVWGGIHGYMQESNDAVDISLSFSHPF